MSPLRIRLAEASDAEAIAAIYRPIVEETIISFETTAPGGEEMAERIRQTLPYYPWLVCDIGGAIAGYAYASRHRVRAGYQWSVDTSVYIDMSQRRQGVGRGLYGSLMRILAAQGYINAFAGIALPNAASVALHEAVGFTPVGVYRKVGYKLGAWHDTGWWQLTLSHHVDRPSPPATLSMLQARPDWAALLAHGEGSLRIGRSQEAG